MQVGIIKSPETFESDPKPKKPSFQSQKKENQHIFTLEENWNDEMVVNKVADLFSVYLT